MGTHERTQTGATETTDTKDTNERTQTDQNDQSVASVSRCSECLQQCLEPFGTSLECPKDHVIPTPDTE